MNGFDTQQFLSLKQLLSVGQENSKKRHVKGEEQCCFLYELPHVFLVLLAQGDVVDEGSQESEQIGG